MQTLHPQYLVDEQGTLQRVVLDIDEFKALMAAAGRSMDEPQCNGSSFLSTLGWTSEETSDTRARLQSFEEDWNAPGMEQYDSL